MPISGLHPAPRYPNVCPCSLLRIPCPEGISILSLCPACPCSRPRPPSAPRSSCLPQTLGSASKPQGDTGQVRASQRPEGQCRISPSSPFPGSSFPSSPRSMGRSIPVLLLPMQQRRSRTARGYLLGFPLGPWPWFRLWQRLGGERGRDRSWGPQHLRRGRDRASRRGAIPSPEGPCAAGPHAAPARPRRMAWG